MPLSASRALLLHAPLSGSGHSHDAVDMESLETFDDAADYPGGVYRTLSQASYGGFASPTLPSRASSFVLPPAPRSRMDPLSPSTPSSAGDDRDDQPDRPRRNEGIDAQVARGVFYSETNPGGALGIAASIPHRRSVTTSPPGAPLASRGSASPASESYWQALKYDPYKHSGSGIWCEYNAEVSDVLNQALGVRYGAAYRFTANADVELPKGDPARSCELAITTVRITRNAEDSKSEYDMTRVEADHEYPTVRVAFSTAHKLQANQQLTFPQAVPFGSPLRPSRNACLVRCRCQDGVSVSRQGEEDTTHEEECGYNIRIHAKCLDMDVRPHVSTEPPVAKLGYDNQSNQHKMILCNSKNGHQQLFFHFTGDQPFIVRLQHLRKEADNRQRMRSLLLPPFAQKGNTLWIPTAVARHFIRPAHSGSLYHSPPRPLPPEPHFPARSHISPVPRQHFSSGSATASPVSAGCSGGCAYTVSILLELQLAVSSLAREVEGIRQQLQGYRRCGQCAHDEQKGMESLVLHHGTSGC